MTSIRHLLADVLTQHGVQTLPGRVALRPIDAADALLASPLADIIDFAASVVFKADLPAETAHRWLMDAQAHADLYALLADWRASRAEPKPPVNTPTRHTATSNSAASPKVTITRVEKPDPNNHWWS